MRRVILLMVGIVATLTLALDNAYTRSLKRSDKYIRDRVLQLNGNGYGCTGFEVRAASGKHYTLTAAHCEVLIKEAHVKAESEEGEHKSLEFIAIDVQHDVMLLEAFDNKYIDIANRTYKYEKVHTIAHGGGMPAYRDTGEVLRDREINMVTPILDEEQYSECVFPQEIIMNESGFACLLRMVETTTTLHAIGGASGGPALNEDGEVIGLISSGDGDFTSLAKLADIKAFLKYK